jgi:putative transposase
VGYRLEAHLRASLVVKAMKDAIGKRKPGKHLLFHSDRGTQYTCDEFQSLLIDNEFVPSMSRLWDCWDNAVAESFFGTLKTDLSTKLYTIL